MATEAIDATEAVDSSAPVEEATAVDAPESGGAEDAPAKEQMWPDDWRHRLAGEDEKALKKLERIKSPNDLFRSWDNAQAKIRSGEFKATLPDNPTDQDIAAYREQNGIPAEHSGYLENLPDGVVVGDDDKPIVDGFLQEMHKRNAPPEVVHEALGWYYKEMEERAAALAEEDKRAAIESEEELRAEWGAEYRQNWNAAQMFLDSAPGNVGENLKGARLADGSPLLANPDVMRWLVNTATEVNPAATVIPSLPGRDVANLDGRIKEIEQMMRTNRSAYNQDTKTQDEYRRLIEARDRMRAA